MKLLATIFLISLAFSSHGQNYIDLLKLDYDYGLDRPFEDNSNADGHIRELAADVTLPIVISKSFNIVTGMNYERLNVSLYSSESESILSGITLKAGANIIHSDRLSGTYILLPKISSDMEQIGKNDYQIGGIALFKYSPNSSYAYKFGMYMNTDLFGPMFVPIFGYYKSAGKLETNFTLPLGADINYQFQDNLKLGVKFTGTNKSYHLNRATDQYAVKINNEIGPYLMTGYKSIKLQIQAGAAILRSYRTYNKDDRVNYAISLIRPGDNRVPLNTDFKDGLFIKTSLIYRFDLSNN